MLSGGKKSSVGVVSTVQKKEKKQEFPQLKPAGSTKDLLKDWSKTIELVEKHPLSQARVINTAVLTDLTQILNSMNEKLDKLAKIDEILSLLSETKGQLEKAGLPTRNVDVVIGSLKGLTLKDQDALKFFKDKQLTTEGFADNAGLSRSTASSRLNKLYSMGLLEKTAEGKQIVYQIKQQ